MLPESSNPYQASLAFLYSMADFFEGSAGGALIVLSIIALLIVIFVSSLKSGLRATLPYFAIVFLYLLLFLLDPVGDLTRARCSGELKASDIRLFSTFGAFSIALITQTIAISAGPQKFARAAQIITMVLGLTVMVRSSLISSICDGGIEHSERKRACQQYCD
jgi:hypothetical protein